MICSSHVFFINNLDPNPDPNPGPKKKIFWIHNTACVSKFSNTNARELSHKCITMRVHVYPLLFSPQVKNKPYRLGKKSAFVLENGAVANSN